MTLSPHRSEEQREIQTNRRHASVLNKVDPILLAGLAEQMTKGGTISSVQTMPREKYVSQEIET